MPLSLLPLALQSVSTALPADGVAVLVLQLQIVLACASQERTQDLGHILALIALQESPLQQAQCLVLNVLLDPTLLSAQLVLIVLQERGD